MNTCPASNWPSNRQSSTKNRPAPLGSHSAAGCAASTYENGPGKEEDEWPLSGDEDIDDDDDDNDFARGVGGGGGGARAYARRTDSTPSLPRPADAAGAFGGSVWRKW